MPQAMFPHTYFHLPFYYQPTIYISLHTQTHSPYLRTKEQGGLWRVLQVQVDLRAGFDQVKEAVLQALGGGSVSQSVSPLSIQ